MEKMEVYVREICSHCGGSGKNEKSYTDALDEVRRLPRGGVIAPGQIAPPSGDELARSLMKCTYCEGGYIMKWIPVSQLADLLKPS